ncbi:protein phosphatase methylesterase 1-like [Watersipora subatra]|uniref:protein phosphatase methylesterase 1-like n=1 Tax=Watersipora subatra TaxID=2589382 RepID=UPI00355BC77C
MSDLRKKVLNPGLPPMGLRPAAAKVPVHKKRNYSPIPWSEYFDERKIVNTRGGRFCTYRKGSSGPLLVCLHGGGFSALTWALFSKELVEEVECRVLAIDQRGHGDTETDDDADLSIETLSTDVGAIIGELYPDPPPLVLMGHSMGGAVAVHASQPHILPSQIALLVLDVVEGSAMEALSGMRSFLRGRPPKFKSLEHAIEWSVRTGQIKNSESARVSMGGQVKPCSGSRAHSFSMHTSDPIAEEEPSDAGESSSPVQSSGETNVDNSCPHEWRVDLEQTEQYWSGWFQGLSARFLDVAVPKVLILAGIDRLDKDLAVGQMQGKFQMNVVGKVGHAVHEDAPDKVADVVATFLVRNKFTEPLENFHRQFPSC